MKDALEHLIKGYQFFRENYFEGTNLVFEDLVKHGQQPKFLVVACSDSRVDPAIVLNCQPGDLFVVRNVANLIPLYEDDHHYHGTSAALEFGVQVLGIQHIIVFGHSQCGGITSLFNQTTRNVQQATFLNKWMELLQPTHDFVAKKYSKASREEQIEYCCQHALRNSLQHLHTFPWIAEKIKAQQLVLHAWYFELTTGLIHAYDEKTNEFKELLSVYKLKN